MGFENGRGLGGEEGELGIRETENRRVGDDTERSLEQLEEPAIGDLGTKKEVVLLIPKDFFKGCANQHSLQKLLGEKGLRQPNFDFADFKKKLKDQPEIIDQRLDTELEDQSQEDPFIKHDQDYDANLREKSLSQIKFQDSADSGADGLVINSLILKKIENHYESNRDHISLTKISTKPHPTTFTRATSHHQPFFHSPHNPRPYSPSSPQKRKVFSDLIGYKDKMKLTNVSTLRITNNKEISTKAQNLQQYSPQSKFLHQDVSFDINLQKSYLKANKEKMFQYVGSLLLSDRIKSSCSTIGSE